MKLQIVDYIPLAKSLAYKNFYSLDIEDKFQESCLGLLIAQKEYNEKAGIKFATFAISIIMNRLKMLYRKEKNRCFNIDEIVGLQDNENEIELVNTKIVIQQLLTKIEYKVLKNICINDYTQKECAIEMGIAQSTVSKILNRSIEKLRGRM